MYTEISLQRISTGRIDLKTLTEVLQNGNAFFNVTLKAVAFSGGKFALPNVSFLPVLITVLLQK